MFFIENIKVIRTKGKGKGVFATDDISPGTIIGDYIGEVIRPEDEDEIKRGLYTMYYSEKVTIEADKTKKGIHLINHSCTPNCGMYTYKRHCLYYALRKIFACEELTVLYCMPPPDDECKPCTHECKCDSPMCAGSMHLSQKEYDRWDDYVGKQEKGTSEKPPAPFGSDLPVLKKYPKLVSDQPINSIYGNLRAKPHICKEAKMPEIKEIRRRIRETGRTLYFPRIGLNVEGVMYGRLISTRKKYK